MLLLHMKAIMEKAQYVCLLVKTQNNHFSWDCCRTGA